MCVATMKGKNFKIRGDSCDSAVEADEGGELILRTKVPSGPSEQQQQHRGSSPNNSNHPSQPGSRSRDGGRRNTS